MAFTAGVGGTRQLFVQLVGGGAPLQITRDPVDHEFPRWSPDSSAIFYFSAAAPGERQGNIWEIPALGGVPRRVVNSVSEADVSPTSGRLALFRLAREGIQLVTAPTDGSRFDVVADVGAAMTTCIPAGRRTAAGLPFSGETASGSTSSWRRPLAAHRAS